MKKLAKRFVEKETVMRAQRASCYCQTTCWLVCQEGHADYRKYYGYNLGISNSDYQANVNSGCG